jgi:hypothetical protein
VGTVGLLCEEADPALKVSRRDFVPATLPSQSQSFFLHFSNQRQAGVVRTMTMTDVSFDEVARSADRHNDNVTLHKLGKRPQLKVSTEQRALFSAKLIAKTAKLRLHLYDRILDHIDGNMGTSIGAASGRFVERGSKQFSVRRS